MCSECNVRRQGKNNVCLPIKKKKTHSNDKAIGLLVIDQANGSGLRQLVLSAAGQLV